MPPLDWPIEKPETITGLGRHLPDGAQMERDMDELETPPWMNWRHALDRNKHDSFMLMVEDMAERIESAEPDLKDVFGVDKTRSAALLKELFALRNSSVYFRESKLRDIHPMLAVNAWSWIHMYLLDQNCAVDDYVAMEFAYAWFCLNRAKRHHERGHAEMAAEYLKSATHMYFEWCDLMNTPDVQEIQSLGGRTKWENDPRTAEKERVRECWKAWQNGAQMYRGKAAFARAMIGMCKHLESTKVIEDWCRLWEKSKSPPC